MPQTQLVPQIIALRKTAEIALFIGLTLLDERFEDSARSLEVILLVHELPQLETHLDVPEYIHGSSSS